MSRNRRSGSLFLALAVGALALACDDAAPTDPAAEVLAPPSPSANRGAVTQRGTFTDASFGPAPVEISCLELEEPLLIGGTWSGWQQVVLTPRDALQVTEYLDYSDVSVWSGDLTWGPSPGAHEPIVIRYPEYPPDAWNDRSVMHEFHVRYLSQDGLPDLRVIHRIHRVLGPDGELRRNEGVPPSFRAECLGGGS